MDLSYFSLGFGKLNWGTDFFSNDGTYNASSADPFSGELTSKAVFLSAYYNWDFTSKFRPYLGFGLGVSRNKFHVADESFYSKIDSNTETEFAYKLDIGSIYQITPSVGFNFSLSLIDIGDFKSGKSRTFYGSPEAIAQYKFLSDGLSPVYSLGFNYSF